MNFPFNLSLRFGWKKENHGVESHLKQKNINLDTSTPFIFAGKDIKAGGDIIVSNQVGIKSDLQIARELVAQLENKRVLYNNYAWEVPTECIDSLLDLRRFLTNEVPNISDTELEKCFKHIRNASINFLNASSVVNDKHQDMRFLARNIFEDNLATLRAEVSKGLAPILSKYDIQAGSELMAGLNLGRGNKK